MATTTTNFGFDIPTSSDLVKNGATAIAELGKTSIPSSQVLQSMLRLAQHTQRSKPMVLIPL